MRSVAWILLGSSMASSMGVMALPAPEGFFIIDPTRWSLPTRYFFEAVGKKVEKVRDLPTFPNPPSCILDTAAIPLASAQPPLLPPSPNYKLAHVALGRGTQNYSCADDTANTKPVSVGAKANLYNVTCLAAISSDAVSRIPSAALEFSLPEKEDGTMAPAQVAPSGFHYFVDTVPTFDVGIKTQSYGFVSCKKDAAATAPDNSPRGQHGQGYGSVPWLKLSDKGGSTGFKEVYRLNTAGGNAPPTCQGMNNTFEVQYAALYWFLSDTT